MIGIAELHEWVNGLGTRKQFSKDFGGPIVRARDLGASDREVRDLPPISHRSPSDLPPTSCLLGAKVALGRAASLRFTKVVEKVMLRRTNEARTPDRSLASHRPLTDLSPTSADRCAIVAGDREVPPA